MVFDWGRCGPSPRCARPKAYHWPPPTVCTSGNTIRFAATCHERDGAQIAELATLRTYRVRESVADCKPSRKGQQRKNLRPQRNADGRGWEECHAIRAVLLTLESSGADSSVLTEDAWKIQAAMRVRPFGMAGRCDGGLVPFVAVALAGWL